MSTVTTTPTSSPSISRSLMIATYAVGGFGLAMAFAALGRGNDAAAATWAAALAVGGSGIISFLRHAVFHRSDAARMHWDYGRRNDFQIEVGLANLSWGLVGIGAWLLDWGTEAKGAVILVFGVYMLGAALLHASELRGSSSEGGHRYGSTLASVVFAGALLVCGVAAVSAS